MTDDIASIQPNASSLFERIEETVSAERWPAVDVKIIRRSKDPWTCPEHLLNFLAFERSVDVWDPDWPTEKKRKVIAQAIEDHRLKGTQEGIRRYIDHAGGELIQVVTPPQGFFISADLTPQEWQYWVDQMPRVRVTFAKGQGEWIPPSGLYLDTWYLDEDFEEFDDGRALYGRQAFLRETANSEDQPLLLHRVVDVAETRQSVDIERVVIPGEAGAALVLDDGFLEDAFFDGDAKVPEAYTYALDRAIIYLESQLELTAVPIGYRPRDIRYYTVSDIGDALEDAHVDDWHLDDDRFLTPDEGGMMLADVLYLLNPGVVGPVVDGISFTDVSRLGMAPFTAELMIDATTILPWGEMVLDVSFLDEDFVGDEDLSHLDKILDAVEAAKALRDKILVTFETTRQLTIGDAPKLSDGFTLGARVPATL